MTKYTFDKEKHVHTLDGKALYGTTTILGVIAKPILIQWAANVAVESIKADIYDRSVMPPRMILDDIFAKAKVAHRKKKEEAGTKGTDVHEECELYIKHCIERGGEAFKPEIPSEKQLQNFIDWAVEKKVKFLASEKNIYSERMWVGGIADIICEIDGKRYVGDIKTSSGIYPEHFIQASAYAAMLKEMEEKEFYGVIIINLKKDGSFDVKENYDLEGNLKCFESALCIYKHLNEIKNAV